MMVLDAPVSVFQGSTNTTPVETIPLADILQRIQNGTYQQFVEGLRQVLATQGKIYYDTAKKKSVAFTPTGVFAKRANAKLVTPSRLLNFDFDHPRNLIDAKARLRDDPWIVYVFESPSGDGLKVSVGADGIVDDTTYKHAWGTVLQYFQRTYPDLAVANDAHCKDISRLCYVSFDPDLHMNPDALLYAVPRYQPPTPKPKPTRPTPAPIISNDRRRCYAQQALDTAIAMIQASIPPTATSPGTRHETRLKAARLLGGYVAGDILSYDEAYNALHDAVAGNTDHIDRSMATIVDGLRYGQQAAITLEQLEQEREAWIQTYRASLVVYANGHRHDRTIPDMTESQDATPPQDPQPPVLSSANHEGLLPYPDYTNACAFVRDHGENVRYCFPWKTWLVWTGTHWQRDTSGAVMRLAKATVKRLARHAEDLDDIQARALMQHVKTSLAQGKLKALVECAQSEEGIPVQPEDLDTHPWLLNCRNGTLDLRSGDLRPHDRADLLTFVLPASYDALAACPTWQAFLKRVMGNFA